MLVKNVDLLEVWLSCNLLHSLFGVNQLDFFATLDIVYGFVKD